MNIRKNIDYSTLFDAVEALVAAGLPQMELYREIGRVTSHRPEKGAAVAVAEYLTTAHPEMSGFSPRNLRRMRDFYRMYENAPELLELAMNIGWTQNVVILEADLTLDERGWYLKATAQFGWTKLELTRQIKNNVHLDEAAAECYTENQNEQTERSDDDKNSFRVPWDDTNIIVKPLIYQHFLRIAR
jgi:predicted nuclease of restriction endonuclease-like (RecB) superfamily